MDKKNFKPTFEFNSNELGVFVETAGYRSAKQQVESFLYAGESLKAARASSYDSDEYEPEDDPSLDIRNAELSEIGEIISKKMFQTAEKSEEAAVSASSDSIDKNAEQKSGSVDVEA